MSSMLILGGPTKPHVKGLINFLIQSFKVFHISSTNSMIRPISNTIVPGTNFYLSQYSIVWKTYQDQCTCYNKGKYLIEVLLTVSSLVHYHHGAKHGGT